MDVLPVKLPPLVVAVAFLRINRAPPPLADVLFANVESVEVNFGVSAAAVDPR